MIRLLTGGLRVLERLEKKVDELVGGVGSLRSDVVHLKARDGEHERLQAAFMRDNWPRVEETVVRTSENLARLTQNVADLAETVRGLDGRVSRSEQNVAELRRLEDAVMQLRETDTRVVCDLDALKKTTTRWGGGLAVMLIVGGVVFGMVKLRIVADDAPAPPAVVYYAPPTAPPTAPPPPSRHR